MKLCFFDESGDSAILTSRKCNIQPALVICALVIDSKDLAAFTKEFLTIKRRHFPTSRHVDPKHHVSWIMSEVKGNEIRKDLCSTSRNTRRAAFHYVDQVLSLVEKYHGKIFGNVWIKEIGVKIKEVPVYTASVHNIFETFQHYLTHLDDTGFVIGDYRTPTQNSSVAHSIFSAKMSIGGDRYDRIHDVPTFSHSENSACLQVADLLASAILWPLAMETFCRNEVESIHIRSEYSNVKQRLATRTMRLQYRYKTSWGKYRGGIVIDNRISRRRPSEMFSTVTNVEPPKSQ